jgi:hypothetical protein
MKNNLSKYIKSFCNFNNNRNIDSQLKHANMKATQSDTDNHIK